jgi:16S rRNA (guanine527-N7)-methyltransferase
MNTGLEKILVSEFSQFSEDQRKGIQTFYTELVRENAVQNLTRLIEPRDFVDGHLIDAVQLLESGFLRYPAMDLGSGGGIPGLLCAVLSPAQWFLVDSEKKKAEFLEKAAVQLQLSQVRCFGERAEGVLAKERVQSVVARAVGKITKIYGWLRPCSTWNTLVLLKGPAWEEEWKEFLATSWKNELKIANETAYTVGAEQKKRKIVLLERVPRGTSAR